MLTILKNGKYLSLIAACLLAVMLISPLSSMTAFPSAATVSTDTSPAVKLLTPCQVQKNAQSQAVKLCSAANGQYSILQEFQQNFYLPSEKLMFLFILGLLAVSPLTRLYKPPRLHTRD
ncbi:hypothetical protein [Aquicella siphonis]|nr:hypothetical protein [Aquicella siphonis]